MSRACAVVGVGVAAALAVAAALGAGAVGVAVSGCRTIAPAPDVIERDALAVELGADPEAEAHDWEARGELEQALRWRRAIALARPADAGARRELVRAGLLVGRGDEKAGAVRRAMGLDAVDYVWLAADKAAASEEVARLCLAAGLPRLGVRWARRAVGYGGEAAVVRRRLLLLGRLALEIGDGAGAREVLARLTGTSTSTSTRTSTSTSTSTSPSPSTSTSTSPSTSTSTSPSTSTSTSPSPSTSTSTSTSTSPSTSTSTSPSTSTSTSTSPSTSTSTSPSTSTSTSTRTSTSPSPSTDAVEMLGDVARGASVAAAALARELLGELVAGSDPALAAEAQHLLELLDAP